MPEALSKVGSVLALFAVLVVAATLGYIWGATSTEVVNTGIWQLANSYQGAYVQAVSDAYALDNDSNLAAYRLSFICQENEGLENAYTNAAEFPQADAARIERINKLRAITVEQNTSEDISVCNVKSIDSNAALGRTVAPIGLALMLIGIVGFGVMKMISAGEEESTAPKAPAYKPPASVMPSAPAAAAGTSAAAPAAAPPAKTPEKKRTIPGFGRKKEPPPPVTLETAQSAAQVGSVLSKSASKTDFAEQGMKPPIIQFMTTFMHGDDLYDDSFSIETSSGEFLGETGVSISEKIGDDGKQVTAFEVWLFDKNDIRTITKVLMSAHAFSDDAIRAKLAAKGEAALAKIGDKLVLETASIRIQARIVDSAYGSGPSAPPESFFERVTIELAAWKKEPGE